MAARTLKGILDKITESIVGVFDTEELQERIVDLCMEIYDAEAASIFLCDEDGRNLRLVAARGYTQQFLGRPPLFTDRPVLKEQPENEKEKLGINSWIALSGRPFSSANAKEHQAHPHWRGDHDALLFGSINRGIGNFMGYPLQVQGEAIGVLNVEGKRGRGGFAPFSKLDHLFFEVLATHVAIAITNARSIDKIQQQRAHEQKTRDALHSVIDLISKESEQQIMFDQIISLTSDRLSAEACVLFLKERDKLIERAGDGYVKQLIGIAEYKLIPEEELAQFPESREEKVGLTAWIAITGQPFLAKNNEELMAHPHWKGKYDKDHYPSGSDKKCNSFLGVPLVVANEVVGVLKVENKIVNNKYRPFDNDDQQLMETLARSISIVLGSLQENRLKIERAFTDALYRVSEGLTGKFQADTLLKEIVTIGKGLFNAEACVVFLVDENDPRRLVEAKAEGYAKHLEEIAEYQLISRQELKDLPASDREKVGITAWIAITGNPFLARNNEEVRAHPHWKGKYDKDHYPGDKKKCESFLGFPLKVGDQILGVLKVENKLKDGHYIPFNEREITILQIIANSAAVAIKNSRLIKEQQKQNELHAIGLSAAAMAHRMNSPLQVIQTSTENLEDTLGDTLDPKNKNRIGNILESVHQMKDAIGRVKEASRPLEPHFEDCDITEIIEKNSKSNAAIMGMAARKGASISIDAHLAKPAIRCDKNLIGEVIENLVANSLDAVAENGNVRIYIEEKEQEIHLFFYDDGPGIDSRISDKLFEPFNSNKQNGLGLGLFIVRRNVEAHQGSIQYIKQDSCFRIELPRNLQQS